MSVGSEGVPRPREPAKGTKTDEDLPEIGGGAETKLKQATHTHIWGPVRMLGPVRILIIGRGDGPPVQIRELVFTTGPASLVYVLPKKLANGGTPTHHPPLLCTECEAMADLLIEKPTVAKGKVGTAQPQPAAEFPAAWDEERRRNAGPFLAPEVLEHGTSRISHAASEGASVLDGKRRGTLERGTLDGKRRGTLERLSRQLRKATATRPI